MAREKEVVKIIPEIVPNAEWQTACRILNGSIRLALSDPVKKADYQRWKEERGLCKCMR